MVISDWLFWIDSRFTRHFSRFTNLDFFLVNGDYAVRAHHGAAGAANAVVIDGVGVVIALTVHFFRQFDAFHWAYGYADAASFAMLGIDDDLSFKCHNLSVIRLI